MSGLTVKGAFSSCFLLLVAFTLTGCQSIALRRDSEGIRDSLLKEKPLGTSMKDVEEWVKANGWKDVKVSQTTGLVKRAFLLKDWKVVGVKSISVTLGVYVSFPVGFTTTVGATWGFNAKDELN